MGEFWTAILAGVAVSLWNKLVVNGGLVQCYNQVYNIEKEEITDDSSTSSTITQEVHIPHHG